ncbi:LCP family protein [Sporosarcina pasteurii]|uniref:Transcriptional regulator ywtF n=1 Tax=Sporosarcina pasteurii TaxID=1474 RepID=A0A380BFP7_SPOPA|nr:LCP family protein [Sporosarcina pasteurii]MDS9470295.1 LCP family protein [Sporosarcina pasteurii]QBQ05990.1 LytR family transcriptional regulator [Sporosarcina pasteurii]SUI99727.1 Putative transcriptional regulator ywtF [Sporosarcina pasteurii]
MRRQEYKQISRKRSGKRLTIKISLLVALIAFTFVVGYGVFLQKKATDAAKRAYEALGDRAKSELRDEAVEPLKDNVSILFIGVDDSDKRKDSGNARSDALLVATLNNKEKTVKLLSIPRDSYVYVPSRGRQDKITHAHAFGGTKGTIDAVEGFLDIPIDYYVKMNFNAFIEVVDALGGIKAEVPYDRVELDENDRRTIELKKGLQHLDGKHALALARTRKLDSDVERGKRQQMILQAIMNKAFSVQSITKYGDVIDAIGDNMKTNMTYNEMKSFLEYAKGGMPEVTAINLDGTDDMTTGIYYWMLDEEELENVKFELQTHLELSPYSRTLTDKGVEINDQNESADESVYTDE